MTQERAEVHPDRMSEDEKPWVEALGMLMLGGRLDEDEDLLFEEPRT